MTDPALEQRRRQSRRPVLIGIAVLVLVALGLGLYLPGFDRGYDLAALLEVPWTTGIVYDQPDGDARDPADRERYTADYAEWALYTEGGAVVLDIADLRLAIGRLRHEVEGRQSGRFKISTRLAQDRGVEPGIERIPFGPLVLERRIERGVVVLRFLRPSADGGDEPIAVPLRLSDRSLSLSYTVRKEIEHVRVALGRGRNLLVLRPDGRVEQQLGSAELERLLADAGAQRAPR